MSCGGGSIRSSGRARIIPVWCSRLSRARSWQRLGGSGLLPIARPPGAGQTAGGDGASLVSADISPGAPHLRRLFLHGIHVERSSTDLFGRARQRGRRSAQIRQRSGSSGDRRRPALPAWLFPPGDRPGRSAAGALSLQRSRTIAGHAGAPAERRVAAFGDRVAWILRLAAGLAGPSRPHQALPARHERRRQRSRCVGESPASFMAAARNCA